MASDGQVTLGQTVVKHGARKVRRLYHDRVLAGFAGSAADGFALYGRFEAKLEEHRGQREERAGGQLDEHVPHADGRLAGAAPRAEHQITDHRHVVVPADRRAARPAA